MPRAQSSAAVTIIDVTGSMKDDVKITALKTAAKGLPKQLKDAATASGDVYISIIPFNKDVAWDSDDYNAPWLRWDLWQEVNGSCSKSSWKSSKTECQNNGGKWTAASKSTWNGCITDRDQNYDTTNTAPNSSTTRFPVE